MAQQGELRSAPSEQGDYVATGSAPALGACRAVIAVKKQKSRKAFNGADFWVVLKIQKSMEFAFDHSLSHFHVKTRKIE